MIGLRIKALKDEARVLGLVLKAGHEFDLDIMLEQAAAVRAAVDSGDIAVLKGEEALPASAPKVIIPDAPAPAVDAPMPKGKAK